MQRFQQCLQVARKVRAYSIILVTNTPSKPHYHTDVYNEPILADPINVTLTVKEKAAGKHRAYCVSKPCCSVVWENKKIRLLNHEFDGFLLKFGRLKIFY